MPWGQEHCPVASQSVETENAEQEHGAQPKEVRLKKSGRQVSQALPPTPGLQGHWPEVGSQTEVSDPSVLQPHAGGGELWNKVYRRIQQIIGA